MDRFAPPFLRASLLLIVGRSRNSWQQVAEIAELHKSTDEDWNSRAC
jgi:hypothetical protein